MGLDPVTVGLGILTLATTVAGTAASASAAEDQAEAQARVAAEQMREITRQQDRRVEVAQETGADRSRQADKEFATITASMAEAGALGTTNYYRMAQEAGFNEGLDLARIASNRDEDIQSLQSEKRVASEGAAGAARQAEAVGTRNTISTIGSGLQIAGSTYGQHVDREIQRGRTTQ